MDLKGITKDKQWVKVVIPRELHTLWYDKVNHITFLIIQNQFSFRFKSDKVNTNGNGDTFVWIGRDIEYDIFMVENGKINEQKHYVLLGKKFLKELQLEKDKLAQRNQLNINKPNETIG